MKPVGGPPDERPGQQGRGSWASSPAIRRTMQGNRRRDTSPELKIRRLLHAAGLRYRVDWPLPFDRRRRADIVFPKQRLVVFIDGCFWHGCPEHYVAPQRNADFWAAKIEGNINRDRDTDLRLEKAGWEVLRLWEHLDPAVAAKEVAEALADQSPVEAKPT